MLVLAPLGLVGVAAFLAAIAVTCAPLYVVPLVLDERYLAAILSLILWVLWLRFGGPVRRFLFEGLEHSSL